MQDITPAPVWGQVGEAIHTSSGQAYFAGGVEFFDPDDKHCKEKRADGERCRGWASGDDGRCAGCRRSANKVR